MARKIVTGTEEMPEDRALASDHIRPQSLDEYIGQQKLKENLSVSIEAARLRGDPLDHVLLYGPPGLGKTTLAGIIANEMGTSLKVTSGPAIEKPGEMAAILNSLKPGDVLFVDEIHRLARQVEEVLYPAMEDYAIDIVIGKGPTARSIRLDLPPFTLVGATTRPGMLSAPLRDRFGVAGHLDYYSVDELSAIIRRTAGKLHVEIDGRGTEELARRSRGTPRLANRLLKRVRDYAMVRFDGRITSRVASEALDLLEVDQFGLEKLDRLTEIAKDRMEMITSSLNRIRELHLHATPTDMRTLVSQALDTLALPEGIRCERHFCDEPVRCMVDEYHTRNALKNIFVNAVDALQLCKREDKVISVTVNASRAWVSLSIRDNGPGIPKQELRRVMMPFVSTKSKTSNWGIGLPYAFRVVNAQLGQMRIQSSDQEDKSYTQVDILLPRERNEAQ